MHQQAAFAADGQSGCGRNDDAVPVQGVVACQNQIQNTVVPQTDTGFRGSGDVDVGKIQGDLCIVRDADVHIHTVGLFAVKPVFPAGQEDAGIFA